MAELSQLLQESFTRAFGHAPLHTVRAPGRVNLIGEHTDYNEGFVLPCAIGYQVLVAVSPRNDNCIDVVALDIDGQRDTFSLDEQIVPHPGQGWSNYIRGVCAEMRLAGHSLRGCNLALMGNIPQGAGLSSSAALENGVIAALSAVSGLALDPVSIAKLGQAAENKFVGCDCGIMDQLISATALDGHATVID